MDLAWRHFEAKLKIWHYDFGVTAEFWLARNLENHLEVWRALTFVCTWKSGAENAELWLVKSTNLETLSISVRAQMDN